MRGSSLRTWIFEPKTKVVGPSFIGPTNSSGIQAGAGSSEAGLEQETQRVAGAAGLEPALSRVTAGCPSTWTTPQQNSLLAVLPPVAH